MKNTVALSDKMFDELYKWSLRRSHELQTVSWHILFVWTPKTAKLYSLLGLAGSQLIFLLGESGQGKTATINVLNQLPQSASISWSDSINIHHLEKEIEENESNILLFDLKNYGSNDRKSIIKDLNHIQKYWVQYGQNKKIVVTLQKALPIDHFFLDQGYKIELEPIPVEKMVKAITKYAEDCTFTQDALRYMAGQSQGNFRKLQVIVKTTLDAFPDESKITRTMVQTISSTVNALLESQLQLIPHGKRNNVKRVHEYIKENPYSNQKTIAKALKETENKISRLLTLMLKHKIVKKKKGDRNENLYYLP